MPFDNRTRTLVMVSRVLLQLFVLTGLLAIPVASVPAPDPFQGLPITNTGANGLIPNSYIVVYNKSFSDEDITKNQEHVKALISQRNIGKRSLHSNAFLSTDVTTMRFSASADGPGWNCMHLEADENTIKEISDSKEVEYVEADVKVQISSSRSQTNGVTPGLVRLSSSSPGGRAYTFDDTGGAGITIFVIDTGIMPEHEQFEGRATFGVNLVDKLNRDGNGHGTHVAATCVGKDVGVAKQAKVVGVKVLDSRGAGANSGVLAGMQFVVGQVNTNGLKGKAVLNMSLGGSRSKAVNQAIKTLVAAGVVPVVAAGNENQDSNNTSPGSAPEAITVGAIDQMTDQRASFSNFGGAVDIYGPGVNVESASIKSTTALEKLSGTSMASPHIAGLAAYLMSLEGLTTTEAVVKRMSELAKSTGASVKNNVRGTTNLIANNGFVAGRETRSQAGTTPPPAGRPRTGAAVGNGRSTGTIGIGRNTTTGGNENGTVTGNFTSPAIARSGFGNDTRPPLPATYAQALEVLRAAGRTFSRSITVRHSR